MRTRVAEAIEKIEQNGWIKLLEEYPTEEIKEKHNKLRELLPETKDWVSISIRQLFFELNNRHEKINLGICRFYWIGDHKQYCYYDGVTKMFECLCHIPQIHCVIRDGEKPKDDKFLHPLA